MAPYLSLVDQRRLIITLPSPAVQRSIADILGALDEKIDLNRRMNQTLEAMARAIFKSWFVDFDPVHAKAQSRRPPGLDPATAALFPGSFQNSPLGRIPKGWHPGTWGESVTLEYGKGLTGYETSTGTVPVFGTNGQIGWHDRPLCEHPGIVVGRKGAYRGVHFSDVPFHAIDTAFFVKPKRTLNLRWAYYQLLREDINGMDSGSAIPSTSREDFYALSVIVPPFEIQERFAQVLGPAWQRQRAAWVESEHLAKIRDVLLPKLLSGELRIRDAERIVEEVG